jgi:hypothetical protein
MRDKRGGSIRAPLTGSSLPQRCLLPICGARIRRAFAYAVYWREIVEKKLIITAIFLKGVQKI